MSTSKYMDLTDTELYRRFDRAEWWVKNEAEVFSITRLVFFMLAWAVLAAVVSLPLLAANGGSFWGWWWLLMAPAGLVLGVRIWWHFQPARRYRRIRTVMAARGLRTTIDHVAVQATTQAQLAQQRAADEAIRVAGGLPAVDEEAAYRHAVDHGFMEYWEARLPANHSDVIGLARRDGIIP